MAQIDIFNGDADGICALTQLRNAEPLESTLITGVKRDIALVAKAEVRAGDRITVLDLSFDKNRDGVLKALQAGAEVFYVDHHFAGEIPESDTLTAIIDPDPNVCTSLLVNGYLKGKYVEWAVTGAFGDNLKASARTLAGPLGLSEKQLGLLENLGVYMNYNGYGSSRRGPALRAGRALRAGAASSDAFCLRGGSARFVRAIEVWVPSRHVLGSIEVKPTRESESAAVYIFPNEPWARRVSGVYSNDLANDFPRRAHAVLTERPGGTYLVSVRAPLDNKQGADDLCRQFATGGGRAAAAGINALPHDQLDAFVDALARTYP